MTTDQVSLQRMAVLWNLVHAHDLEALLVYGDKHYQGFLRWALGTTPQSSGTYLLLHNDEASIMELSYRLSAWSAFNTLEKIPVPDEDLFADTLYQKLAPCSRIGILGPAPATHLWRLSPCEIVDVLRLCPTLMTIKAPSEMSQISCLAQTTALLMRELEEHIKPGMNEQEIAGFARSLASMRAEGPSFSLSVVSGDRLRTATVGAPTTRTISTNDAVLIDMGLKNDGLVTDITRMFFCGNNALKASYEALYASTLATASDLAPGMSLREVAVRMRSALKLHGLPVHSLEEADLGHGIGFDLHEHPMLIRKDNVDTQLDDGMIITLEPEITVDGFKLRVEEMVAISSKGPAVITR